MNVNRFIMHMEDVEVLPSSRALGDVEGHPFHGNQWTSGAAQLARDKAANDPRHFLDTPKGALSGLLHHEMVNIDRHDVRDLLELAAKQKEDPDLTNLHVEGTQLFGGSASRLTRKEMPQIPGEHREDFVAHERERGIQIDREDVSPLTLSPMQSEVSARAVGEQLAKYGKGDKTIAPILISKDNRVLDGHHHWAMMATLALENPSIKVPAYRIQESAHPALFRMRDYANLKGHASVAIGEKTPRNLGDVEGHPFHGNQWTGGGGSFTPSPEEDRVISNWAWPNASPTNTGMAYEHLRDPKTAEGKQMTALLNKLPVHDGVTYRGIALDKGSKELERLVSSKGYEMKLHSSASKSEDEALNFLDGETAYTHQQGVLLEVHGRGRDINPSLPEELRGTQEVVLPAGNRYRFASLSHESLESREGEQDPSRARKSVMRIVMKEVR